MGLFDSIGGIVGSVAGAVNPVGLLGTVLAGGGAIAGDIMNYNEQRDTNQLNIDQSREARMFSAEQASKQMDFQREMASTQYSRAAKDLQAAGINPMLAAGAPSAAPSGAAGGGAAPDMKNPGAAFGELGSSARDVISMIQSLRESNSRIGLNMASADAQTSTSFLNDQRNRLTNMETELSRQQKELVDYELSLVREHPDLWTASKMLSQRGLGIGSALDIVKPWNMFGGN